MNKKIHRKEIVGFSVNNLSLKKVIIAFVFIYLFCLFDLYLNDFSLEQSRSIYLNKSFSEIEETILNSDFFEPGLFEEKIGSKNLSINKISPTNHAVSYRFNDMDVVLFISMISVDEEESSRYFYFDINRYENNIYKRNYQFRIRINRINDRSLVKLSIVQTGIYYPEDSRKKLRILDKLSQNFIAKL